MSECTIRGNASGLGVYVIKDGWVPPIVDTDCEVMEVVKNEDYAALAEYIVHRVESDMVGCSDGGAVMFKNSSVETENFTFTLNGMAYYYLRLGDEMWGEGKKIDSIIISAMTVETDELTDFDGSVLSEYVGDMVR